MTRPATKREAPATALPARYLVDVGNGSPDEYGTFTEAHAAWLKLTSGRGKLWRNDESDDGEHLDGLSAEERSTVAGPLSKPHRSEADAARRERGLVRIWLHRDTVAELDAQCEENGLTRDDQIRAWARSEREELAEMLARK